MVKIIENNAKQLPYETLFELGTQVIEWVDGFPMVKEKVEPLIVNVLKPAHKKLDICINTMRGLSHTDILAGLDGNRDNLGTGMGYIAKAYSFSPVATKRNAANLILKLLKSFKGINRKEYDKQTGSLRNLIGDLRSLEYKGAAEEIGLTGWIDDLEDANNKFAETVAARDDKTAVKVSFDVREVRREFGDGLNTVCNYLNASALMEEDGKYDEAFNRLNVILARYAGKSHKPAGTTPSGDNTPDTPSQGEGELNDGDKYPDAREWAENLSIDDGWNYGSICYIIENGVKRYFRCIKFSGLKYHPTGENGEIGWQELE